MSSISNKCFILIIGQPKAGTTSVFDWLAQNPQVAPGRLKELRFFLDPDYPLPSRARFDGVNLDPYLDLFQAQDRGFLLDATPDYMGCNVARELPKLHPNSKAILIVREPVERMVSAFRYYRSIGRIAGGSTFEDYVEQQARNGVNTLTPPEMRALDHCRISHYVDKWAEEYGANLMVIDFEEVREKPERALSQIYSFIGLDPSFIDQTNFEHSNKTRASKHPKLFRAYAVARSRFAIATLRVPFLYRFLKPLGVMVRGLISGKGAVDDKVEVTERAREIIAKYAQT